MAPKFLLHNKDELTGDTNHDNCSTRDFVGNKHTKDEFNRKLVEMMKDDERSDENNMTTVTAGEQHNKKQGLTSDKIIKKTSSDYKMQIRWLNVFIFIYLHIAAIHGCYLLYFKTKWVTFWFTHVVMFYSGFGVTAGAHRLWAHKAYKAKLPLRILLMVAQTVAHQNSIYSWVRDHRIHHKFTDTDADPYNAKRGFFFSHIGWLMVTKHPLVIEKGNIIDMEDMKRDPVVMFQKKFFVPLMILLCFFIPTIVPVVFFDEPILTAFHVVAIFRYVWVLNTTWSVNSAAHIWGMKPFNKESTSVENAYVAYFALGEGWHNYHHVFPWDYKTAELGNYGLNWTTAVIDFFAKIGWAYNLKTVSDDIIRNRVLKTGDGSHKYHKERKHINVLCPDPDVNRNYINNLENHNNNNQDNNSGDMIWGWDDHDIRIQDKIDAVILNGKT